MSNISGVCAECQKDFVIAKRERRWFEKQGLQLPIRCKPCRESRKQQRSRHNTKG